MASEGAICWVVAVVLTITIVSSDHDSVCQCTDLSSFSRCYDCPCNDMDRCAVMEDAFSCFLTGDTVDEVFFLHYCTPVLHCPAHTEDYDTAQLCHCDLVDQVCFQCIRKEPALCGGVKRCIMNGDTYSPPCQEVLNTMYSCTPVKTCTVTGTAGPNDDTEENDDLVNKILIPVPVCITVIVLVTICTVILALYWRFKIKAIRERNVNIPMRTVSCTSANQQTQEEPLYSVIDAPPAYTEPPPKVPPNSYQSDGMCAPYEMPAMQLSNSLKQKARKNAIQQYEEPINSLQKVETPKTATNDIEKQNSLKM